MKKLVETVSQTEELLETLRIRTLAFKDLEKREAAVSLRESDMNQRDQALAEVRASYAKYEAA